MAPIVKSYSFLWSRVHYRLAFVNYYDNPINPGGRGLYESSSNPCNWQIRVTDFAAVLLTHSTALITLVSF